MLVSPSGDPVPRVLTAALARQLGFTMKRMRVELCHGRWQHLTRGVYLTRVDRPTRSDWIAAGLAIAGPGAVLSGWDAARARGIGSERPPVDEVLILSTGGTHRVTGRARLRPSSRSVTATRLGLPDGGFGWAPMASTARAVTDTSLVYRWFDPVRALVTSAVQRRLCTPDELAAELDAGPQNGSTHLRRALEDVFAGVESISEGALADLVREHGLPIPEFNVPILTSDGRHIATADALWRELRAALEVDSKKHHFYEDKWRGTMNRHNRLTIRGLSITHYPPAGLLSHPAQVADEIDEWLRGRAVELGVPYPPQASRAPVGGRQEIHVPFVLSAPAA